MNQYREAVKFVVTGIVGLGTGRIVKQVIKHNTPVPEKRHQRVTQTAGAYALGGLAADATRARTNRQVDHLFDLFGGLKKDVQKNLEDLKKQD